MDDVTATASGFVAVGRRGLQPAAWTSTDGSAWMPAKVEALDLDPDADGGSVMHRVAAGPNGLIAVGNGRGGVGDAALWESADGADWTLVADPLSDIVAVTDIGVMPDGRFVLAGASSVDDGWRAGIWGSSDDRTWTAMPGFPGGSIAAFVPWRGGLVAVGTESTEDRVVDIPAIWMMTSDGVWDRIADVPGNTIDDRDVSISAITVTADRLVATGPSPTGVVGIWTSTDGRSWMLADEPGLNGPEGRFEPRAIVAAADRLVVVGEFPNEDPSFTWSAAVWTNPAPGRPAGPTPAVVAHPCPTSVATLVDVAELTPPERLECFAGRDITLRGYLGGWDGGVTAFPATPGWLADTASCCRPLLPLPGRIQDVVFLAVAFEPAIANQSSLPDETVVEVTGHFDDKRAQTCRQRDVAAATIIEACRQQFVVTSLARIGRP